MDTTISIKLSDLISNNRFKDYADEVLEAAAFKLEKAYVDESPADIGDLKGGIKTKKVRPLEYIVESTAKNKGRSYPLFLFEGTYRMKGKPDFGFTTGRVRAGDVAYGIGGIRPNKASTRTIKKSRDNIIEYIKEKLYSKL